jgi:hypothetical protein
MKLGEFLKSCQTIINDEKTFMLRKVFTVGDDASSDVVASQLICEVVAVEMFTFKCYEHASWFHFSAVGSDEIFL